MNFLSKSGKIQQQKNRKFRIISITNWDDYQCIENVQQLANNSLTTSQQHANTYKNVKNDKKEKKGPPSRFLSFEELDIQRAREANAKAIAELLRQSELAERKTSDASL